MRSSATLLLISLFLLSVGCQKEPVKTTLIIAGGATGQDLDLTIAGVQRFMKEHPNIRVAVRPIPRNSPGRLELYQQLFAQNSDELDVLQIDVVWTGMLADEAVDLGPYFSEDEIAQHFPSMIENNTVEGKLVAVPWFTDAPSLFYRADLLEKYGYEGPPATWEDLEAMSLKIMAGEREEGNLGFWGYVWQGNDYEGLTCNALEWQVSAGGGSFIDAEGRPQLARAETIEAFRKNAAWIDRISPRQVLSFDEEESQLFWERGDAAFLRNWSYVYASAKSKPGLADQFKVASLPAGPAGPAATLGGWQLMVSRHSLHREESVELVRYLTSFREQKLRAIEGSHNPTIRALYEDPEVVEAVPFFQGFERVFHDLIVRPSTQLGANYDAVSQIYRRAAHEILQGADAEKKLGEAEAEMKQLLSNSSEASE